MYLSSNNSSYVISLPYFNQFRRIRRSILVCSNLYACKIIEYHTESYVRMLSHYLQIVKDRAIALDRHVYLLLRVCWSFPVCEWMYVIGNGLHSNGARFMIVRVIERVMLIYVCDTAFRLSQRSNSDMVIVPNL